MRPRTHRHGGSFGTGFAELVSANHILPKPTKSSGIGTPAYQFGFIITTDYHNIAILCFWLFLCKVTVITHNLKILAKKSTRI